MLAIVMKIAHILSLPLSGIYFHNSRRVRVLVLSDDCILLQRSSFGTQRWSLPGGGIKRRETDVRAAIREVAEETSVALKENKINILEEKRVLAERRLTGQWPTITMVFLVARMPSKPKPRVVRPLEVLEVKWFKLSELPENCSQTVKIGLKLLRQHS